MISSLNYYQQELNKSRLCCYLFIKSPRSGVSPTQGYDHVQQISCYHYNDVTMGAMASQNTSLTIFYSNVYSGADQRKHSSSASLAFVGGIHRWPVNSQHKWPVMRKMFPFGDVIMIEVISNIFLEQDSGGFWNLYCVYIADNWVVYSDKWFLQSTCGRTSEVNLIWKF